MDREPRRSAARAGTEIWKLRHQGFFHKSLRMAALNETALRDEICRLGASLFSRGLTFGSAGNISVRLDDGWLMTPTNVSLGQLDPARLAKLDAAGKLVTGDPPTKEAFLHRAMYEERPQSGAVVHLHS